MVASPRIYQAVMSHWRWPKCSKWVLQSVWALVRIWDLFIISITWRCKYTQTGPDLGAKKRRQATWLIGRYERLGVASWYINGLFGRQPRGIQKALFWRDYKHLCAYTIGWKWYIILHVLKIYCFSVNSSWRVSHFLKQIAKTKPK